MAMFLIVGCQTTQSSDTETKLETINKKISIVNPFKDKPIESGQLINSSKPVVCGRADAILTSMYTKYGEGKPYDVFKNILTRHHETVYLDA